MQKKKLTGWLILLIIWIGFVWGMGSVKGLRMAEEFYVPMMEDYPRLRLAVTLLQTSLGVSIAVWVYAAWLLFRREPGSLGRAQNGLLAGGVLRIATNYVIPLLGGLPADEALALTRSALPVSFLVLVFTASWHLYLSRSRKVRDIYAG